MSSGPHGPYYEHAIESRISRVEQQVLDVNLRVNSLMPMATTVIELKERLDVVKSQNAAMIKRMDDRDEDEKETRDSTRQERIRARWAFYALTVAILCALIAASTTILTHGGH